MKKLRPKSNMFDTDQVTVEQDYNVQELYDIYRYFSIDKALAMISAMKPVDSNKAVAKTGDGYFYK